MNITLRSEPTAAPLRKPWKNAIAIGRAYELLRRDVVEHLAYVQRTIGYRYCRFHGLFHDEMAVVSRRPDGSLAYRWHQVDKIYDTLLALGLKPFVELNPMPSALASGTDTIFDWKMNVTPPTDYGEWGQLVGAFARHLIDRYGLAEVCQWYFEVWNEPNLSGFWTGTQAEYWQLYDASARALKAVDSALRVGGPASSKARWVGELIDHCTSTGVPLDFVSTHLYPQDEYVDYPERAGSPHPIGRFFAATVRSVQELVRTSARPDLEIHWTEWNTLSKPRASGVSWTANPTVDSLFGAGLVCDLCVTLDDAADTLCWWVASDVFEESGMPQSEFSFTYGLLTINGLPKATHHAFALLNRLRGPRLALDSNAAWPIGTGAVATVEDGVVHLLLWNREVLELSGQASWQVGIDWARDLAGHQVIETRIAARAGSAWETWRDLGSPQTLSPGEFALLQAHAEPRRTLHPPAALPGFGLSLAPGEVVHLELRPQGQPTLPKTNLRKQLADWEQRMSGTSR